MVNKVSNFTKIDADVKNRAVMYITNSKLTDGGIKTMNKLVEVALDEYMINNPL